MAVITNALKELKRTRAQQADKDHNPFTRILLKAPLCAQALNSVRSTFEELDKGNKGYIVFSDIEAAFDRLDVNFTKEEIGQVFHESDMLENGRLTFKEFLVYLAIGFLLHKIPSLENERLSIFYAPMNKDKEKEEPVNQAILFGEGNKLRVAFQLAVDAFLWFDVDGSGQINRLALPLVFSSWSIEPYMPVSRDEMAMRLGSSMHLHSPTKKMSIMKERTAPPSKDSESINSIISERRFNEMDWNHDGSIQFKEFLLAFESWVGIDDDDGSDC
ncbi:TPA: hypothetical protein N0F65_011400 [Lagenidium giganteum]|uniref:EF-hand domain-containing protein n=1 Tax=Lagenidium giganteum TaxID=4803 RepID=A0AAV2ZDK7_9STRA|nr:TPA: hypothetical protein N0F65_011400 [Lagenidium giganteum]